MSISAQSALASLSSPYSLEAEQALLGSIIIDNNVWDKISDRVSTDDFYLHSHSLIFSLMLDLRQGNQPIDHVTLSERLNSNKELEKIGGIAYLAELANNTPSAANAAAYAKLIHEKSILRQLISTGHNISQEALNPDAKAEDILDLAQQQVFRIAEKGSSGRGALRISQVFANTINYIEAQFAKQSAITGLATGFSEFDRYTCGLQPGELIIIAARPSMGKTTLALNIAEYVAMHQDLPALIFSMEMSAESLGMRLLSSLSNIELQKIRTGRLQDEDWLGLSSAIGLMAGKKLLVDDSGTLSPLDLRAKARRIARENGGLGLIIVDYLQLMSSPTSTENRAVEISEISRSLKSLAKELHIPIIALSQLNRSLEQRAEKRPFMADLRESGAIEQDADLIAFIYRDEVYNKESKDKGIAEIIIGKQRNGPTGTFKLTFIADKTKFLNHASSIGAEDVSN